MGFNTDSDDLVVSEDGKELFVYFGPVEHPEQRRDIGNWHSMLEPVSPLDPLQFNLRADWPRNYVET